MKKIAVVSLCNRYAYRQDWFKSCVGTWHQLLPGVDKYFVSDGSLNEEEKKDIEHISTIEFYDISPYQSRLNAILQEYPSIARQRELCVFYRRIIDFAIYFQDYEHILNLDTDIVVLSEVKLPEALPDFAYCVDDVPGYSASPKVAVHEKIVPGLNAGFLLFKPDIIDFDFIEHVTEKYISKGKTHWWAEQTCWALIAANLSSDTKVFSPNSVAIVSGLQKRTLNEIKKNKTSYFSKTTKINDLRKIQGIIGQANVIHFAGPGKPWISPVLETQKSSFASNTENRLIRFEYLSQYSMVDRSKLYLRLLLQASQKK